MKGSAVAAQNLPSSSSVYPSGTVPPVTTQNYAAGIKVNYTRNIVLTQPLTTEASIQVSNYHQTRVQTNYLDGLGRPIQTVDHFASPQTNDVVSVIRYDNFGRDAWHFLPYAKSEPTAADNGKFKLTAYTDQKNFYKNTLGYTADNFFYTQTNYEESPLNRIVKTLPQGNAWVGNNRGKTISENALPAGANIRLFTIGYAPGSLPVSTAVYGTGDLLVKKISDEDGSYTEEYITKDNRVVLRTTGKTGITAKLLTYYVYDDFGLLRYVISPKAAAWLAIKNWTLTAAVASELCFAYEYDGRLRPIVKKIPGGGSQYMIYNNKDELILTQSPAQTARGEYLFNKYDVLGRLIQTGVYNNGSLAGTIQAQVNASNPGWDPLLTYLLKDVYGNAAYETTFANAKVLTTSYYDDYSFTSRSYDGSFMNSLSSGWNNTVTMDTSNLLTGTKVVVLDGAASPTELLTVHFYNDRGLLLQTQSQNHKGSWNYITSSYDFSGQKLGTYTELNNPQASDNAKIKTVENFSYDHSGRLIDNYHSLNELPGKASPLNTYDDGGRLIAKTFANSESPGVNYEYNVRGWLTGINKEYCREATGEKTFGMEISYDYGYATNYLSGNIAGIKWRNSGKGTELRSYGYLYDSYNRLREGSFVVKTGSITSTNVWSNATKDFTASNMNYDENGNISSMKQMGMKKAGVPMILDDLTYTYQPNSNKLERVDESAASLSKDPLLYNGVGDFRDVNAETDYLFDENGNLLTDGNKDLHFSYDEITGKTIEVRRGRERVSYLYDALGNKLQKYIGPISNITTDYVGSAVYINNSLSFIQQPEGRIRYTASSPTPYMYDYYIKDHLGSTRSVVTYTNGAITGFAAEPKASREVKYIATSEVENAAKENHLFDNVDNTRSANPSKKVQNDNYVAKISSKNNKSIIGPDITLRVMAGDSVKISTEALYLAEANNPKEVVKNAVTNFVTAFATPLSLASEGLNTLGSSSMKELASAMLNLQDQNSTKGAPKAYLNYILYDEYMNMIKEGSGAIQVKEKEGWQTLETEKMQIPENGFLRVFTNNMEAAPVSINNTTLALISGKLVEEYNYYPYGLVFGASSANSSIKKTDYLYNGKELQHNEFGAGNGLELEDYGARMYDVQIGRWTQGDPLAEKIVSNTPYNYCLNSPINMIDPDGMLSQSFIDNLLNNSGEGETEWQSDGNGNFQGSNGGSVNGGEIPKPVVPNTDLITGNAENGFVPPPYVNKDIKVPGKQTTTTIGLPILRSDEQFSLTVGQGIAEGLSWELPGVGIAKVFGIVKIVNAAKGGTELFNFSTKAAEHMANSSRAVPVQILEQAIKSSKGVVDPRGSRALMYTTEMLKNGKVYNLEVLYDKATNSIWHFKYSPIKP